MPDTAQSITAAVLVIGDEILSGRTKDKNIGYIADYLVGLGIDLCEVRIVPDIEAEIIAAVNALRERYTYVFTTGGIGPTHDDITADCIAKAFGVAIEEDPRAIALMLERYRLEDLNAARRRMARIPAGAELIENAVSKAPGFQLGNVIVMAGVPSVMHAMLDAVAPRLKTGAKVMMVTIEAEDLPEGAYAAPLGAIAASHAGVGIGSYPSFQNGAFHNRIVVRGKDEGGVAAAVADVRTMLLSLAAERIRPQPPHAEK
jgi:molybdenum cofactor synthesis domain-containing protein